MSDQHRCVLSLQQTGMWRNLNLNVAKLWTIGRFRICWFLCTSSAFSI